MNKVKKYIYVIMLLVTFVIASPFMVVKIWNSSELKTVAVKMKEEKEEIEESEEILEIPPVEVPATLPTAPPTEPEPTEPETVIIHMTLEPPPTEDPIVDADSAEPETDSVETVPTDPPTEPPTELQTEPPTEAPTEPDKAISKFPAKKSFAKFVKSDPSYFDDALFIGDSRTEDIKLYGSLSGADFFCSVGLSNYKVNTVWVDGMQLSDYLSQKEYGKVYIMLGLNEIADNIEYTTGMYRSLVEQVREAQPTALIFIEANLHVTNWYSQQNPSESNERLDHYNQIISEFANDKDIFYIDVNEIFDDENGALPSDHTGDGVHPYAKYYSDWSEWLCKKTIYK